MLYLFQHDYIRKQYKVGNTETLTLKVFSEEEFRTLIKSGVKVFNGRDTDNLSRMWRKVFENNRTVTSQDGNSILICNKNDWSLNIYHSGFAYYNLLDIRRTVILGIFTLDNGFLYIVTNDMTFIFDIRENLCFQTDFMNGTHGIRGVDSSAGAFKRHFLFD